MLVVGHQVGVLLESVLHDSSQALLVGLAGPIEVNLQTLPLVLKKAETIKDLGHALAFSNRYQLDKHKPSCSDLHVIHAEHLPHTHTHARLQHDVLVIGHQVGVSF